MENSYKCDCTKEDFKEALKFLPLFELNKLKEKGNIKSECEVCKTEYELDDSDMDQIIEEMLEDNEFGCSPVGCSSCSSSACGIND